MSAILLAAAGAAAHADPALTIEQAYALTIARNPDLAIAHENVVQAEIARRRSRSGLLPTVTVSGTYTRATRARSRSIRKTSIPRPWRRRSRSRR